MPNDTIIVRIRPEFIRKFVEERLSDVFRNPDMEVVFGDKDEMNGEEVMVQWRDAGRRDEVPDIDNIIEQTRIYLRVAEPHE